MKTWTVQIGEKPVCIYHAPNYKEAQSILNQERFKSDLLIYEHEETGRSLWDGITPLTLREATSNEHEVWSECTAHWQLLQREAGRPGEEEEGVLFLVPAHEEPTEFDSVH